METKEYMYLQEQRLELSQARDLARKSMAQATAERRFSDSIALSGAVAKIEAELSAVERKLR